MGVKKRKYSKTPILKTFHFIKKLVIIMFIYVHFLRYLSGRGCVGVGGRLPIHYLLIAINKIFEQMRLSTNYSLVL